jgi:hypothetical protein
MPRVSQEAVLGEVAHRAARESIGGASVIRPLPSRTFHARHRRWQEQQAELQQFSDMGQYTKSSPRADVFRFAPNNGRYSAA